MHVPDGFISAPVCLGAGVVSATGIAYFLRRSRRQFDERLAPLAGLTASFIFAAQMLNFPVAAGTSGHLIGAALATVVVGPGMAVLCMAVVLLVQALLFADGGLTALGVNIGIMALVGVAVAHVLFRTVVRLMPDGRTAVTVGAFVAGALSVPAVAVAFVGVYAIGGTTEVSLTALASAMVGVHTLIGLGEGAITAVTIGSILTVRPDLIHGARGAARRTLVSRARPGVATGSDER